ncbi:hypothetical protein MGYG_04035 [Nannizzia gypsea CBS 118893]|uniref:Uncharacterized protein n=1 Tax=Arthroderma gypseum (strain ATCC MYA-4604 / CBS 118893) TaxID=535722 RepID=E4UUR5_ARTGP|nr:hypothetical protein MGYG_04035 [Nannizzia gypsea CBS 118893]EFR01032.1 hypothetical protein MGYG_04035 [Nannizzia gypsea CBS 118893]
MAYSSGEPASGYLDDSTSQIELLLGSDDDGTALVRLKEPGRRRAWTARRCYCCLKNLLRDLILHQRRRFRYRNASWTHTIWLVFRVLSFFIGGFILVSAVQAIFHPSYQRPPAHYAQLQRRILGSSEPGRANPGKEKIFIAANIIREDLIRGAWGDSLLELIALLGEDNVFVSIYENDSGRASKRINPKNLQGNSSVVAGDHLRFSDLPTTTAPGGKQRIKRIAYLAEVRNRALRPLDATTTHHPLNMETASLQSSGAGVYINPFIRVAYTENTWIWLNFFRRYERIFANLQWIVSRIGYPEYNPRRLHKTGQMVREKVWVQGDDENQAGSFQMLERKAAAGGFCGQRRMFVMKDDINDANKKGERNWEKIPVPSY